MLERTRGEGKALLPSPDYIVLGHKEYVVYLNPHSGNLRCHERREKGITILGKHVLLLTLRISPLDIILLFLIM